MSSSTRSISVPKPAISSWLLTLFALIALAIFVASPLRAAPLAGTNIGNAASATYTDASAVSRTATSNTVTTVVQQVASETLSADQSKVVSPGGTVYYPHTLTNTGNGTDTFALSAVDANTGTIAFTGLVMYADANGDGLPDNATPITTSGPLAPGGVFKFVVAASVGTVNDGQTETITVTSTSGFTPTVTALNTDTVTVSANAVVNVTKSITPALSGAAGSGPYTVTLTYTNSGNSTATDVALYDALPTGMSYVAGSGRWNTATVLTDAAGGDPTGVTDYTATLAAPFTVSARIASVAPGVSGTVSFQVSIAAGTLASTLVNTAKYCYDNNGATAGGNTPAACDPTTPASVAANGTNTNSVNFTVVQTASVTISDTGVSDAPLAQSDADALNDVALVNAAVQGGTVSFKSVITNTGNGNDTFTVATSGSTFPSGTTFQLFQSDGVTPLVGTTPSLAPNGTYTVFVKAILPIGATGGGPYNVTVTATSVFDPTKTDTTTDRLTTITASTVDVRNIAPGTGAISGAGAGPEVTPVTTNAVNPGGTTTFPLQIANTSTLADNYDLAVSSTLTAGAWPVTPTLPVGWTVSFRSAGSAVAGSECTAPGGVITNTGTINAGATLAVCAVVTVPAGAVPVTTDLYFRARSAGTGAFDIKHDAVSINTVRSLTLAPTPSQSGQIFPTGSVTYTHTITNTGNVVEGDALGEVVLTLPLTGVTAGWTAIVYWDQNNNGTLDATDPVVTDLSQLTGGTGGASTAAGLDPNETARLFVKVTAPANTIGDVNTATLTATTTGLVNTVAAPPVVTSADQTTIIGGQVSLNKRQAIDANCDGVADGPFVVTNLTTGAIPGACIRYEITATNVGTTAVTGLVVSDATPPNTTYHTTVAAATTLGTITPPAGTTGTVQATIPTLNPGQSAVITFGVRIDP